MNLKLSIRNVNPVSKMGRICVYIDFYSKSSRKQLFIKTPVKIQKSHWLSSTQKVSKSHPNHKELNELLTHEMNTVLKYLNELKYQEEDLTAEKVQNFILIKNEGAKDIVTLINDLIQVRSDLQIRMIQKFQNLATRLEDFANGSKIYVSDIDQKFVNSFTFYLQRDYPNHKNPRIRKSQSPSTIHKTFKLLRQVLSYYADRKIIRSDFELLSYPKGEDVQQMILTEDEIKKLFNYKPTTKRLEKVQDLALLQFLTGLRYSDAVKIKQAHVFEQFIRINTKKTKRSVNIPILPGLQAIFEKYKDDESFLKISNVKYNEYLKELAELAGINVKVEVAKFVNGEKVFEALPKHKLIASHSFRRAFVTHSILKGIPSLVVQSMTGHTTMKQLSEYAIISESMSRNEIDKLYNVIFDIK